MTVLQNLNAYLTERLMVAAGEILEVVAKTILEYQEETARTVKENEELRRRLREVGGQNNLMSDGAQRVAPPVSVGAAAQSQQPHEPQCNSGLEEDREPPQTDIKQEFLEQHESKPEQGAVDLNKQASALTCAENPSEHRILQPSLPFEEKTEEVGCLPHMLPDQIKSELDELDYSPQELPIFSQPLNRINNGSNTAESENLVDMNWMESGGVMPELNEQDSGREVCDIPVVGGLQHVPCTSLKGQTTEDKTNASKASQKGRLKMDIRSTDKERMKSSVSARVKKHREKIYSDPDLLEQHRKKERERYKQRKEKGLLKTAAQLTPTQHEMQKKRWRENTAKYAERKKIQQALLSLTPPFQFVEIDI